MFYKYKKLYTFRFMKEQLKIIYARILGIFTAKDREKVVDFLINSTKYVNIIPFLMFSTIYFLVLLIISDSLNRNIILAGVISIVLSVLYTVFKYRESKLNDMKEELSLILNHINPKQSSAFLIKYLCIDLFKNVIFYAALPYIITGTLLLAITEFNVYLFLILLGYFALSFSLTLCILITKIIIRNQIIFDLFMSLVLISVATYLYTVIPFPENIENIIINNSANLEVKEPTLIAHAVWVSCFIISTIITCLCILKIDSEQFFKVFFYKEKNLNVNKQYQTSFILQNFYRVLLQDKTLMTLNIIYISMSIIVVVIYPLINKIENIGIILTILLFAFTPSFFNIFLNYSIFSKIFNRSYLMTSNYLVLKYNAMDYLINNTLKFSIKNTILSIFPFVTIVILYKPPFPIVLTLLYFLLIILLQCLFIFRSYKIEKYTLEEIAALDNSFILSNGNENMMFLGIPIALSMPLITLYVSEQISWLPSVFIFSYIFILS